MTREELQAINVALNKAKRHLVVGHLGETMAAIGEAVTIVHAELEREDRVWDRVRTAIQESDEAQATFGGGQTEPPLVGTALCHDFAPPERVASFCAEDEPPSRPA